MASSTTLLHRGLESLEQWGQAVEQRVEMYVLVLVAIALCFLFKILNVNNSPEKSQFYCSNQKFLEEFLKRAPELAEPYIPTRFWGFSGHLQTIIQGVISRLHCPLVNGHRVSLRLTDGATVTYDLYHAIEPHPATDLNQPADFTLCICPGIGNNSESVYIRRVVYNAQLNGYRVCVLNHIGTLANVPVTSARIFMYGNTADYAAMVRDVVRRFPNTNCVCVGFSMGGNLISKYLGEPRDKPGNVVAGISVCQGYDANKTMALLLEWKGFRRLYMYAMTENLKSIMRRWTKVLFTDEVKRRLGVTERQVFNAATLQGIDDAYTRRLAGFSNVTEFYTAMSCSHHLKNIKVPMVFINARDDPLVPPPLLEIIRNAALTHERMIFVEQKFGGHLGFYEGGFFYSNPLTWQDRMVIHTAHALVADTDKYAGEMAEGEEDDEGSSDESGEESGHSLGTQLSLERFTAVAGGGGMTSDCTVVDSSDGGCGLPTPPSTPVLRSRSVHGLNIFPQ